MKYAYVRVSSTDQNLNRQMDSLSAYNPDRVFADKQSGKDFDRPEYIKMKAVLKRGDELYIKELDRLGRDKEAVKEELKWFRQQGVIVRILNVPTTMIDFQGQEWLFDMVNNILIEVMGAFAEEERKKIKVRQREGIDAAKSRGVAFGRPKRELADLQSWQDMVMAGVANVAVACKSLGISRAQWYRNLKGA